MRPTALALLLMAAAVQAATPPEARALKEQGDALRNGGDADGAARAYAAALKLDGGFAEAHEAVGELHFAARRLDKAIESFGHAVEIDPGYATAWYNLAFAARRAGDHAKARTASERYVKLRPTDADGHYGLAESQRALGDREAAAAEYQLFVDLAQGAPAQAARVEKAKVAIAELRPPAPPVAETASGAAPAAAGVALLGGAALAVGSAAAVGASSAAPAVIPAAPPATTAPVPAAPPAATATAVTTVPTALPAVTPAATITPAATVTPATVATASVNLIAAAPVAVAAPAVPTPAPPSRALIEKLGAGDRAWLSNDFRTALFAYQDAVYLDPTSSVARVRLARAYRALKHEDQARQQLTQALELDPDNAEARRLLDGFKAEPAAGGPQAGATPGPATAPKVYKLTEDDPVTAPPPAR